MELNVTECNVSMLYMNAILGRDPFLDKARYPVQWRAPMPIVGWWKSPCSSSMKSTCSVCRRQVCWTPVRASRTHFSYISLKKTWQHLCSCWLKLMFCSRWNPHLPWSKNHPLLPQNRMPTSQAPTGRATGSSHSWRNPKLSPETRLKSH